VLRSITQNKIKAKFDHLSNDNGKKNLKKTLKIVHNENFLLNVFFIIFPKSKETFYVSVFFFFFFLMRESRPFTKPEKLGQLVFFLFRETLKYKLK
jgi:hypothetical protein